MYQAENFKDNPGINIIHDNKFNEVIFSIRITFDLSDTYATLANVMANLFDDRLVKYPNKKAMLALTDSLYGVKTSARTYSVGKFQVIEITLRGINESFVDENLHQEYVDLLLEILKEPLINEDTFKEAKKDAAQTLVRIEESPSDYALFESFKRAGKDQLFGVNVYGTKEKLDAMTLEDIQSFHKLCVNSFTKELYAVGRFDNLNLKIEQVFSEPIESASHKTKIEEIISVETYQGNQSEMIQVYETDITPSHDLYYSYLVMLAVLGQSPTSLLFQNIREKNSMSYSIYASQLIFDGLFYIATSISQENEDKVMALIEEQFDLIKEGSFDLDAAKNFLINRISGTRENPRQLLEFHARNKRMQLNDTPEDLIENFSKVTKESVIASLQDVKSHYTYIYRGIEDETN